MIITVYKLTVLTTNKSYIGITNNLNRRISQHKHSAKIHEPTRGNMYLDWIAGGINNYAVEILETFESTSKQQSYDKEAYYISLYNTVETGYNQAYYSTKCYVSRHKGYKFTPDQLDKLKQNCWRAPGSKNPSANRYTIIDELNNTYVCECRNDIAKQLNISFKQAKCIIAHIGEWYTTRVHKDGRYIAGRSFKLLKLEKIN